MMINKYGIRYVCIKCIGDWPNSYNERVVIEEMQTRRVHPGPEQSLRTGVYSDVVARAAKEKVLDSGEVIFFLARAKLEVVRIPRLKIEAGMEE